MGFTPNSVNRKTEVYTGIIVHILDNGLAADVTIPALQTTLPHVPILYPYYHTFKGEGNYSSVEPNAICKVWFGSDGEPFILGFGTGLQPASTKNTDDLSKYMATSESVTPGSHVLKSRYGNKVIVERGGFNLNYVNHLCYNLLTKIKNYAQAFIENMWSILNGGFWHWWTNYKKKTVNFNSVMKDKKDWKKTQLLWVSIGEEGKYIDIVLDDKKNIIFQLHVNKDGTVYLKTPKLSIDSPMTVISGKVLVENDVVFEKQTYMKDDVQIGSNLTVTGKIAAKKKISSEDHVECKGSMKAAGYVIAPSADNADTSQIFDSDITPPAATKEGFDNPFFKIPERDS